MRSYIKKLYDARYFWMHLARIELKNKFRRSKLGILWTFVSPLCLTAIMSVVFATAFHSDILSYAPYILSGILCWEVFSGSFVGGSYVIIANDAYIRQFNHPVTIYTLKSAIVVTISFFISMTALSLWTLILKPTNVLLGYFTMPLTLLIYFIFSWGGITIAALTCTKYRDYPQMAPLILQTLWYISPVFFQKEMFDNSAILSTWFNLNPITHMLQLIRAPFLYGQLPTLTNYFVAGGFVLLVALVAIKRNQTSAREIIFYI